MPIISKQKEEKRAGYVKPTFLSDIHSDNLTADEVFFLSALDQLTIQLII